MILKDSLAYGIARGVPGIVNFLAVIVFTRLLSPSEYGFYALIIAGVTVSNAVMFQWLRVSLARFYHHKSVSEASLLACMFWAFLVTASLVGLVAAVYCGVGYYWLGNPIGWVPIAVALLWGQAWFELCLELARARLKPKAYGAMTFVRALGFLGLGVALVLAGLNAYGLLFALLIVLWGTGLWAGITYWREPLRKGVFQPGLLRQALAFGLPLTATFAMGVVVSTMDRFMLGYMQGNGSAGEYAVSYDLAWNIISLLMLVVNLAAYPHLMRAFESVGEEGARTQFEVNGVLLVAVSLPVVIAFSLLIEALAPWLVGAAFQASIVAVVPVVCVAALLKGLKSFYFDQVFHIRGRTSYLVYIMAAAAFSNLLLNLWLIPAYGVLGAAWATVLSFALALGLSAVFSLRQFPVPLWSAGLGWVLLLNAGVVFALWPVRTLAPGVTLAVGVLVAVVYLLGLFGFNVAGLRTAWQARQRAVL